MSCRKDELKASDQPKKYHCKNCGVSSDKKKKLCKPKKTKPK